MTNGVLQRRADERLHIHLEGRISVEENPMAIACTVSDLSATGARITLCEPAEMPIEFTLEVPEEGAAARGLLIWSNGREHGIRFAD